MALWSLWGFIRMRWFTSFIVYGSVPFLWNAGHLPACDRVLPWLLVSIRVSLRVALLAWCGPDKNRQDWKLKNIKKNNWKNSRAQDNDTPRWTVTTNKTTWQFQGIVFGSSPYRFQNWKFRIYSWLVSLATKNTPGTGRVPTHLDCWTA